MASKAAKATHVVNRYTSPWQTDEIKKEVALEIIAQISEGESLIKICANNKDIYPSPATFLFWIGKDPLLAKHYARAIEIRSDLNVEKILDIADDDPNPARARNRIEARRYHNEKLAPKKYGAKVFAENNTNIDIKQKIDFTMIPAQVRDQLRQAIMKQIELQAEDVE